MTVENRIRFMGNNHLAGEGTIYTYSSQQSAHPFTNAINSFRGKLWKPSGNFTVTTANQKLYVEYLGTPVTVTLTPTDYDTAGDFVNGLNIALDGAGCPNIEFSYSYATGKFSVDGISINDKVILSNRTNAVWDTLGFTTTTDTIINTPLIASQARSMTSEVINIDFGYNALCRFFAIISPLSAPYPLSSSSVVTLKANNINDFTSPPFSVTISRCDGGHIRSFDEYTDNELSYRYWQIEINDKLNITLPSISYIYLGDYVTVSSGNINNGFTLKLVDPSIVDVSESGVKYFDVKPKYYQINNCTVGFLESADRENLMQFFSDVGISTPFFISLDPQLVGSSTVDQLTKFVMFDDTPDFKHIAKDVYTMSFSLSEVV